MLGISDEFLKRTLLAGNIKMRSNIIIWILAFSTAFLLWWGIRQWDSSDMQKFGQPRGWELVEVDQHFFTYGTPYWVASKGTRIYRVTYRDSAGRHHLYWFRFGYWWNDHIYEEVNDQYFKLG